jgi:glyoxylate/hydroxypyruvate reductase A
MEMTGRIAFVSRLSIRDEELWLQALAGALPEENILPVRKIASGDLCGVQIAVVANPDPADIARLTNLKWIHSVWAGVERLVAEPGLAALPIVRLVDPELARTMAEAVLAWTYYLSRDMPAYARLQRQHRWQQLPYRHPAELTVGLLGLGTLGTAAALRLRSAGFNVSGWSRTAKNTDRIERFSGAAGLALLLARADVLVCLLPLTPETHGLLNRERLALMPTGASLIHFARSPIVVVDDLLAALNSGRLSHAVLDVFDVEPLPQHSELWEHPKITVLPHISAPTNKETAAAIVAKNIRDYRSSGVLPRTVAMNHGY